MTATTGRTTAHDETKPFERLVGLLRGNEALLIELTTLRLHIDGVRAYLERPDCNRALGLARLDRLRGEYLKMARRLRDRRREARALMGEASCWPEQAPAAPVVVAGPAWTDRGPGAVRAFA